MGFSHVSPLPAPLPSSAPLLYPTVPSFSLWTMVHYMGLFLFFFPAKTRQVNALPACEISPIGRDHGFHPAWPGNICPHPDSQGTEKEEPTATCRQFSSTSTGGKALCVTSSKEGPIADGLQRMHGNPGPQDVAVSTFDINQLWDTVVAPILDRHRNQGWGLG